jgi:DNA-binding NarL/FixJ family response regulator
MAKMIDIAAVDDDVMLLEGMGNWIGGTGDIRLVATARTVDSLLGAMTTPATVVLLDLVLADRSEPAQNVRRLVEAGQRVLVMSVWSRRDQVLTGTRSRVPA